MRYYIVGKAKLGITLRPTGGGFNDGKKFADPGLLLVQPGDSFEGLSWEQLERAVDEAISTFENHSRAAARIRTLHKSA